MRAKRWRAGNTHPRGEECEGANAMNSLKLLNLVYVWLIYAGLVFVVGLPFVFFLHFFGGHYLALGALSVTLSSYFTLIVSKLRSKLKGD